VNCIGCVLLRGWIASPWKARPRAPLAGMEVQVQVRLDPVAGTPLYKAF
jgi:hypothetical protein